MINFAQAEKITFFKKKENTASEDKLIGTIILHRYRVEKKISITQIYLVWDLAFNVFRIMRIYKKTYDSGSMQMSHRDLDEIFVLMKLNHHAIPKIIDFNEDNEHVLVIREYDEGNSLRKIVKEEGLQPVERIIDWISQICDVLSYLHSQSFILCEVEPGNIILMPDGRLKLSSFSTLTRAERNSEEETRVLFTPLLGEPGYAAPELYETCLPLTPQTDIYGIGAVMHYLLVGKSSASTPFNYPKMKQCCEPLWKNFSKNERKKIENLEDIIDKCVAFDVKDRYKSCAELLKDLNCLQGKPRKSIFGRLFD